MRSPLHLSLLVLAFLVMFQSSSQAKYKRDGYTGRKGNPGPKNRPVGNEERLCMLEDKHSGAKFDLSQLFRLNKAERKFFTIQGASGGPFDHVDMVYDYHFTLCGSVPPTPFDCFGGETIFRAPAYQITRRKDSALSDDAKKAKTYEAQPEKGTLRNCVAIGRAGEGNPWTYSLINKDDPSYGVQIDYEGGEECLKRTVVRTKTESGRDKREVQWIPTPRSTTIKFTCNPKAMTLERSGESKAQGNIERIIGNTQSIHAVEDDMCHYTLTWESPYGCPTNKKITKDRRGGDVVFTQDAKGFHSTTRNQARKSMFLASFFKFILFVLLCGGAGVGVQMFRHWRWMKIILPQMSDPNPIQQKLARKKFVKLILTFGTARKIAPSGSRLV